MSGNSIYSAHYYSYKNVVIIIVLCEWGID